VQFFSLPASWECLLLEEPRSPRRARTCLLDLP
jgi:hypothetical protein